ncbi:MAG: hypothetical protein HRU70_13975 [Phycisphaeraceae bacterium]|nr:MAG: hypothetical protein HRU70_13975 [Phycisphaeraceae bacterium]
MNTLDLLYMTGAAAMSPWLLRKSRGDWKARLGHAEPLTPPAPGRPRVMLHAVSVGEVNALRSLVPILAARCEVVVSVGTDTGIARARTLYGGNGGTGTGLGEGVARVVRYPLDFSRSVARFLDAVKPDLVALVELEVWPNFIRACVERGVPVGVINGRLSERSFRGYRRVRGLLRRTFASLDFAAVQDGDYRDRFVAMGVPVDRCVVTGSMKWDAAPLVRAGEAGEAARALARAMGLDRGGGPLIVAGSTAEDEEALLHAACPPGARLLCAPRKPERFDEAARAMPGCVRRTAGRPGEGGATRFLLDTIGELRSAYEMADVVVMGRSFGRLYGSDPIEPAALGKPVLIGPAFKDFESIVREMQRRGAIVVSSRATLARDLAGLTGDGDERRRLGEAALACVAANRGVSARHAAMILERVGVAASGGEGPAV